MHNQNNTLFCLLLLQQQINLQNELNRFDSLMTMFDDFLELVKFGGDFMNVNPNLNYIAAALLDAKSTNKNLIDELTEYFKLLVNLSLISNPEN